MEVEKEHVKHETGSPFYWGTTETWVSGLQLLFDIMAGPEFKDALSDAIGFLDGNHPDMLFEEIVRRQADNGWRSDKESKCQTASHYQPVAERSLRTAYRDGSQPGSLWHLKGRP